MDIFNACANCNIDEIKRLLNANTNLLKTKNHKGQTPLHVCVIQCTNENQVEAVRYLLNTNNVDLEAKTNNGYTALHLSVNLDNLEQYNPTLINLLLEKGANRLAVDKIGRIPLTLAANWGNCEAIEQLLANNAKQQINHIDSDNTTPLFSAVREGQNIAVETLLRHGAQVNLGDQEINVLKMAVGGFANTDINDIQKKEKYREIITLLLDTQIDVSGGASVAAIRLSVDDEVLKMLANKCGKTNIELKEEYLQNRLLELKNDLLKLQFSYKDRETFQEDESKYKDALGKGDWADRAQAQQDYQIFLSRQRLRSRNSTFNNVNQNEIKRLTSSISATEAELKRLQEYKQQNSNTGSFVNSP